MPCYLNYQLFKVSHLNDFLANQEFTQGWLFLIEKLQTQTLLNEFKNDGSKDHDFIQ